MVQAVLGFYFKPPGWLSAKLRNILTLVLVGRALGVWQNTLPKGINLIQICGLNLGFSEVQKSSRYSQGNKISHLIITKLSKLKQFFKKNFFNWGIVVFTILF